MLLSTEASMTLKRPPEYVRGLIITILYKAHPDKISQKEIWFQLDQLGTTLSEDVLASEIVYLRDKGYLSSEEQRGSRLAAKIYLLRLTPKGIDLMEGQEEDKTIWVKP